MKHLGLKRGIVKLVAHKKEWRIEFEKEKSKLHIALRPYALGIEHVGSTSIPGIPAKPVLDILIGIRSMKEAKKCIPLLKNVGYENIKDVGGEHIRLFFAKGLPSHRTHHLHVVKFEGKIWEGHTAFPHYLRTHKAWAKRYAILKKELAKKFENNREFYTRSKGEFVRKVIRLALTEKKRL